MYNIFYSKPEYKQRMIDNQICHDSEIARMDHRLQNMALKHESQLKEYERRSNEHAARVSKQLHDCEAKLKTVETERNKLKAELVQKCNAHDTKVKQLERRIQQLQPATASMTNTSSTPSVFWQQARCQNSSSNRNSYSSS